MVYLLKMVIFHGYVSHNQMVTFSVLPSIPSDFPQCSCRKASIIFKNTTCSWGVTTWLTKMTKIVHPREVFSMTIIIYNYSTCFKIVKIDGFLYISILIVMYSSYISPRRSKKWLITIFSKILLFYFFGLLYNHSFLWDSMKFSVRESRKFGDVPRHGSFCWENDEYHGIRWIFDRETDTIFTMVGNGSFGPHFRI